MKYLNLKIVNIQDSEFRHEAVLIYDFDEINVKYELCKVFVILGICNLNQKINIKNVLF